MRRKERQRDTCDELTATLLPQLLGKEKVERTRTEAEPRKKGGVGRRCFKIQV